MVKQITKLIIKKRAGGAPSDLICNDTLCRYVENRWEENFISSKKNFITIMPVQVSFTPHSKFTHYKDRASFISI